METEPIKNQTEMNRISALLKKYEKEPDGFTIVPVGEIGYILQFQRKESTAGNNWILFDLDDTLVATTEAKKKLPELYKRYLESLGIYLTDAQASNIIEMTNKFSRWAEKKSKKEIYHANTHMVALQWATNIIRENQEKIDETIIDLQTNLERIKQQLTQEQQPQETDPFYFRPKDKRFVLRGIDKMWSKDIENIFIQTVVHPSPYLEIIEAAKKIGYLDSSINRINIGIFTRGDPYYQLLKILELMKQHPDLPISQIWLTRVPKGDFIIEAIKTEIIKPNQSQQRRQVLVIDDSFEEASSILSVNDRLKN